MASNFALQAFGGHANMFGGGDEPPNVMDLNAGFLAGNPILAMLANMGVGKAMGAAGLLPAQFSPVQNLYDQAQNKKFWAERGEALAEASKADQETYKDVFRGMFRASGSGPITLEQERFIGQVAGFGGTIAPIAMQLLGPDLFEELHGSKGSATVMAQFLHKGGRLAQDSVTGETGMSGKTAGAVAREIRGRFFGPGADPSAFRGLGVGRLGMLYDEIQQRGLAGPTLGAFDEATQAGMVARDGDFMRGQLADLRDKKPDQFARLLDDFDRERPGDGIRGKPAAEQDRLLAETEERTRKVVDKLKKDMPDEYDTVRRNFDAKKIATRLENLSGTVTAMRDIFGDMNKPNAPMRELVEGLNQLTQGGLATQDASQLQRSVRLTQALAQSTGLGMDNMMGLMAMGAKFADDIGVERPFAVQGAQGAAAFGQAFGQVGRGDVAHWQARTKEEMTVLDERLRIQAAKSGMSNQLATTVRVVEDMAASGQKVGPDALALAEAIKGGRTTFTDAAGQTQSVFQDEQKWRALMAGAGVREETLLQYAHQQETNRETTFKHGIVDLTRQAQAADIKEIVANTQQSSLADVLTRGGVDKARVGQLSFKASQAAATALLGEEFEVRDPATGKVTKTRMDAATRRSDVARSKMVAAAMRQSLEAQGQDTRGISDAELAQAASLGFGEFNEQVRQSPGLRGYGSGLAAIEINDQGTLRRQRAITQENTIAGEMRSSLAGIGKAGPLARIVDTIGAPQADITRAIGKALGGVDPEEVRKRLAGLTDLSAEALQEEGITDKETLGVMADRFAEAAGQLKSKLREQAPDDPAAREARNRAMAELRREMDAIQGGPARAQMLLDDKLKAAGLAADDLPDALQDRGKVKLTDEQKRQFQALQLASKRSLGDVAEAAGMPLGARVGAKEVGEVLGAGARLDHARLEAAGLRGKAGAADVARLGEVEADLLRHAGTFAAGADRTLSAIVADDTGRTVRALGKGGQKVVEDARRASLDLQALADQKTGGDVARLLASGDKDASALQTRIAAALGDIAVRQGQEKGTGRGQLAPMDEAEIKAAEEYRAAQTMSDADQNKAMIDRLIQETGGSDTSVSEDDRKGLAKLLGEGKSAEVARRHLDREIQARGKLDALARGMKLDDLAAGKFRAMARRGATEDEFKAAFGADFTASRDEVAALGKEAGTAVRAGQGGEGVGRAAYEASLEDVKTHAEIQRKVDDSGTKAKTQVTGTLRLEGLDKVVMNGQLSGGAGSTPVAPGAAT